MKRNLKEQLGDFLSDCITPQTYVRGQRIFKVGLVSEITRDEHGFVGIVKSETTQGSKYHSSILLDDTGEVSEFECTCPVGYDCKHAVALALKIMNSSDSSAFHDRSAKILPLTIPEKPAVPEDSPLLRPAKEKREQFVIKDKDGNPDSFIRRLSTDMVFPPSSYQSCVSAKDVDKWQLGYILIKSQPASYYSEKQPNTWKISRILFYQKKDGSTGRIKEWGPGYADIAITAEAAPIENLFLASRDNQISAETGAFLIAKLKSIPVYISFTRAVSDAVPAGFSSVKKAHVSFNPVPSGTDNLEYDPMLSFFWGKGKSEVLSTPVVGAFFSGGLMFYPTKERIFTVADGPLANPRLAEIMGLSSDTQARVTHPEAFAFCHAITRLGSDTIELVPPPSHIETVYMMPETEVLLEPIQGNKKNEQFLRCSILFTYMGASMNDKGRIIRRQGDTLELLEKNTPFETEAVAFFRRLAGSYALAQSYGSRMIELTCDIPEFARELYNKFIEAGYKFATKNGRQKSSLRKAKLAASVSSKIDWFEAALRLDVDGKGNPLDGQIVFLGGNLISAGGKLYLIDDKDRSLLGFLAKTRNEKTGVCKIDKRDLNAIAELRGHVDEEDKNLIQAEADLYDTLSGLVPASDEKLPDNLAATFRPYQIKGYSWLMRLVRAGLGALLADDMGLGKTLQAIAVLENLREASLLKPAVIVAPVTVLSNWESEIHRFAPSMKVCRHHGQTRVKTKGLLMALMQHNDILLTSYQTLRADEELFGATEYGMVLIDEAQAVKNPESGMSKAVCSLRSRARIALTGTPVENRPLDLWSHFSFLNPGLLGSRAKFIGDCEKPIANGDAEALALLKKRVVPFIMRRTKEEVLDDLPPKEIITRFIDMEAPQKALYEAMRRQCADSVQAAVAQHGIKKSSIYVLEALLRLRQAAIHPGLISREHGKSGGAKIDYSADTIAELVAENHKVLVFSQFTGALALLREKLDEEKIIYEYLDGQTKDRADRISRFQSEEGAGVFLLSLKAGGVGINLTGADYVILLDPWWNPAAESQAIDRAHRIGQKRKVTVYRLVTRGTIEEKVTELQDKKRRLVEDLLSESADGLASFSGEEILELFAKEPE